MIKYEGRIIDLGLVFNQYQIEETDCKVSRISRKGSSVSFSTKIYKIPL